MHLEFAFIVAGNCSTEYDSFSFDRFLHLVAHARRNSWVENVVAVRELVSFSDAKEMYFLIRLVVAAIHK